MNINSSITTMTPTTFQSWNDEKLTVTITSIAHQQQADQHYITMKLLVAPHDMNLIFQEQWFHVTPQAVLNDVSFESEENIELQLVLMPSITNEIVKLEADAEAVLLSVVPDTLVNRTLPLLTQIELWYATEAMQNISLPPELAGEGQVSHGFRTVWRHELLHLPTVRSVQHQHKHEEAHSEETDTSLVRQVEQFLTENQLKYETHNEELIRMKLQSDREFSWTELIRIEEDARLVILYAVFPALVEEAQREQLALQFMNENYDLMNGAFEMDMEDGELRFRSTLLCPANVDHQSLKQLLQDHIEIMQHYLTAFKNV